MKTYYVYSQIYNHKTMICYTTIITLIILRLSDVTSGTSMAASASVSMTSGNIPVNQIQSTTTPVQIGPVLGNVFNVTSRLYDVTLLPPTNVQVRSILNCAHLFDLRNTTIDAFVYYIQEKRCWILVSQTYGLDDNSVPAVGQYVKIGILQRVSWSKNNDRTI